MWKSGCLSNENMGKLFSKSKSNDRGYSVSEKYRTSDDTEYGDSIGNFKQFQCLHSDAVSSVAACGDNVCLSGGKDNNVAQFNFGNGRVENKWIGHDKDVTKVAYAKNIDSCLSASRDKCVQLWKNNNPLPAATFRGHELVVTGLSVNADNTKICTGSRDNSIRLWDINTTETILQNSISRNLITHIDWAKRTNLIAQSGEDKDIRIFNADDLEVVHTFPRKQYIQTCCQISDDANYCLSCSNGFSNSGCELTLWDMRTRSIVCEYKGHGETVGACIFLPSYLTGTRKLLASCSNDCSVRIWDQHTRDCLAMFPLDGSGPLTSLAIFPDGSLCVSSFNMGIQVLQLHIQGSGDVTLSRKAAF